MCGCEGGRYPPVSLSITWIPLILIAACGSGGGAVTVTFTLDSQRVLENGGAVTVEITLSAAATVDVTVPLTLGGTATQGAAADYTITTSPIVIAAGDTSADITITVVDDDEDEPDETVVVTMGVPTNGTPGGVTVHTCTIEDDDPPLDGFLLLDGDDDRADGDSLVFPATSTLESFTVEAWVYPHDEGLGVILKTAGCQLLVYHTTEPGFGNDGFGIMFTVWEAGCAIQRMEKLEFRDLVVQEWNHVAGMFDAATQTATLAINGKVGTPGDYEFDSVCSDQADTAYLGSFLDGALDEVRISSTVRYTDDFTPEETFVADGSTVALWHFDEPDGATTFADASGNDHTLVGANGAHVER
jgi:hypothetical protein